MTRATHARTTNVGWSRAPHAPIRPETNPWRAIRACRWRTPARTHRGARPSGGAKSRSGAGMTRSVFSRSVQRPTTPRRSSRIGPAVASRGRGVTERNDRDVRPIASGGRRPDDPAHDDQGRLAGARPPAARPAPAGPRRGGDRALRSLDAPGRRPARHRGPGPTRARAHHLGPGPRRRSTVPASDIAATRRGIAPGPPSTTRCAPSPSSPSPDDDYWRVATRVGAGAARAARFAACAWVCPEILDPELVAVLTAPWRAVIREDEPDRAPDDRPAAGG